MRPYRFTQTTPLIAGLCALIFLILTVPLGAETAPKARPYYDITREVTLKGTVTRVIAKHSPGMIVGSHLLLETSNGEVDASLGKWGLQGKGALSVGQGQQVEVTGVMKTLNDKEVFVARTVRVGSRVYAIRNQHGVPLSPLSREGARKAAQKGVSL